MEDRAAAELSLALEQALKEGSTVGRRAFPGVLEAIPSTLRDSFLWCGSSLTQVATLICGFKSTPQNDRCLAFLRLWRQVSVPLHHSPHKICGLFLPLPPTVSICLSHIPAHLQSSFPPWSLNWGTAHSLSLPTCLTAWTGSHLLFLEMAPRSPLAALSRCPVHGDPL